MSSKGTILEQDEIEQTRLGPRTTTEVWKDWGKAVGKYVWKKFHSPMGIYLFSTWLISVFIMGLTNSFRGESFFEGPRYWLEVFMTYGLNEGQGSSLHYRFIAKPVIVWFLSPMLVLLLGTTLYFLADSGFLKNGALPLADENDFAQSYRFFNYPDIWGSELINKAHPKWVKMYIWIVFMPIILGAIVAGLYNFIMFKKIKKQKYLPSVKKFLSIMFIASLFVGIEMALVSGDITLEFTQLFVSLFIERKSNKFLIYGFEYAESRGETGQYHPIALAITMWLIYLIPFLAIYGIFLFIGNLDKIWKNKDWLFKKIAGYVTARQELTFNE